MVSLAKISRIARLSVYTNMNILYRDLKMIILFLNLMLTK